MTKLLLPARYSHGRLLHPDVAITPANHGPRFNDWVANKTTGAGGDYPSGDVWMPGGTYYMDPFDLSTSTYARAYDAGKPYNNWLRIREFDGPGTVTFDLRPESAASTLGQSQTQAYNDHLHGGAFTNVVDHALAPGTAGNFRWCFDGGFIFANGTIFLKQSMGGSVYPTRLMFHGTRHYFTIEEWRRQFDFICGLHSVTVPGYTIPNTATYGAIENAIEYKGNYFPTPFRFEGVEHVAIMRGDIGPAGDDGIFTGANYIDAIGTVIHEVDDKGVSEWHHPDVFQSAGGHNLRVIDCTLQGHLNVAADAGTGGAGDLSNTVFDRIWQGIQGATGGAIYQWHGNTMGPTNKFGSGAPITRLGQGALTVTANASATSTAKAVLAYLTALPTKSSHKLLSGQFQGFNPTNPNEATAFAAIDQIHTNTGQWVGLVGGDYAFNGGDFTPVNNLLTGYWNAGSLVTLSYHMPNPITGGSAFDTSAVDLASMLTPGNSQRTAWLALLDATAAGLAVLRDAGVVVLWRPFHEMNDPFFWWGNRDVTLFTALWVDMFNYFTTTKGLNNLLWVYGAGGGDDNSAAYYPGSAYVDVVGGDHYQDLNGSSPNITGLDNLAALGKPMTLTEFGPNPTNVTYNWPDILAYIKARYPQLAYILVWSGAWGMDRSFYTNASAFLNDPWMANRDTGWLTSTTAPHYYKVFSNGMDHGAGTNTPQIAIDYATGETTGSGPWRSGLIAYSTQTASLLNFNVAVPSGVTVDGDGFATGSLASAIAAFMASAAVPHQLFRAAYATTELAAVMSDYGIAFD